MRALVASILAPLGVEYTLDHMRGVPPVVNEAVSSELLADAALAIGGPDASTSTEQSSGGEDFAWYLEHVPGAMARLGVWSGHGPMRDLHQPTFDLDERALPFGVRVLTRAALSALAPAPALQPSSHASPRLYASRAAHPSRAFRARRVVRFCTVGESPFRSRESSFAHVTAASRARAGRVVHMPPTCPQAICKIPDGTARGPIVEACPFPCGLHGAHRRADLVAPARPHAAPGRPARRRVVPLWTGVVVEAPRLLDPLTRAAAAQLTAGPRAAVCGVTAAQLHGCDCAASPAVHVVVPYGRVSPAATGLVAHHGRFIPDDVQDIDGLRVLALDRVVADLLCILPWRGRARRARRRSTRPCEWRHRTTRRSATPWRPGSSTAGPPRHRPGPRLSDLGPIGPSRRRRAGRDSS